MAAFKNRGSGLAAQAHEERLVVTCRTIVVDRFERQAVLIKQHLGFADAKASMNPLDVADLNDYSNLLSLCASRVVSIFSIDGDFSASTGSRRLLLLHGRHLSAPETSNLSLRIGCTAHRVRFGSFTASVRDRRHGSATRSPALHLDLAAGGSRLCASLEPDQARNQPLSATFDRRAAQAIGHPASRE